MNLESNLDMSGIVHIDNSKKYLLSITYLLYQIYSLKFFFNFYFMAVHQNILEITSFSISWRSLYLVSCTHCSMPISHECKELISNKLLSKALVLSQLSCSFWISLFLFFLASFSAIESAQGYLFIAQQSTHSSHENAL